MFETTKIKNYKFQNLLKDTAQKATFSKKLIWQKTFFELKAGKIEKTRFSGWLRCYDGILRSWTFHVFEEFDGLNAKENWPMLRKQLGPANFSVRTRNMSSSSCEKKPRV